MIITPCNANLQKKGGQAETKPFTNFSVFHDNLITRLKALSQIQLDFDKRVKEAETRFTEKLTDMRKQLDTRWKQIDKFETSVKAYGDAKATWRRKYVTKEGELEALKVRRVVVGVSHFLTQVGGATDHQRRTRPAARDCETSHTGRLARDTDAPVACRECGETAGGGKQSVTSA